MVLEPIVAQKLPYIMHLENCLRRQWPTDFAEEAKLETFDPVREELRVLLESWFEIFGDIPMLVKDVLIETMSADVVNLFGTPQLSRFFHFHELVLKITGAYIPQV